MKAYGKVDVYIHILLTSELLEVSGQLQAPAALPPGKEPPVPIGYEVGWTRSAGLDVMEKRKFLILLGLELRPFGRPARSQSLYGLRYTGL
jgi:hypothetical protein